MNLPSASVHELPHAKLDASSLNSILLPKTPLTAKPSTISMPFSSSKDAPSSKKSFNKNSKNSSPKKNKLAKPPNVLNDCNNFSRKTQTHGTKTKGVVSAHGHLTVRQRYKHCPHSAARSYPLETQLGIDRKYTNPLKSLVTRCYGLFSCRVAEENLRELCGISLSHMTIGNLTAAVADEMKEQQEHYPAQRERFQHAKGETMFGTDGTSVPTRNENSIKQWREMKVGVFAKVTKRSERAPA